MKENAKFQMKTRKMSALLSRLIYSTWLIAFLLAFGLPFPVVVSAVSSCETSYAFDEQNQAKVAYDEVIFSACDYDSASAPSANETECRITGMGSFFAECADFLAAEETVTLYRGVNNSHVAFDSAEQGLVRANGGFATPLEHNTGPVATLRSPYTSWTTDPAVAENFALRPNGGGVVIRAEVPVSQTVPSPNLKTVLLRQNGQIVSESEVLVRGTVRGTPTRTGP